MRSPQKTSNRGFHPMCQAHTCATRTHSFSPWRLNPPVAAWYSFHHVPPHILTMSEPRPPVSCGGLRKHTLRWRLHEALRPVCDARRPCHSEEAPSPACRARVFRKSCKRVSVSTFMSCKFGAIIFAFRTARRADTTNYTRRAPRDRQGESPRKVNVGTANAAGHVFSISGWPRLDCSSKKSALVASIRAEDLRHEARDSKTFRQAFSASLLKHYPLVELGVGPMFEPNTFGGVGKKSTRGGIEAAGGT